MKPSPSALEASTTLIYHKKEETYEDQHNISRTRVVEDTSRPPRAYSVNSGGFSRCEAELGDIQQTLEKVLALGKQNDIKALQAEIEKKYAAIETASSDAHTFNEQIKITAQARDKYEPSR